MLLAPTLASARSCITTVAGDTCLAQCIGELQQACESDPVCHQEVAATIRPLTVPSTVANAMAVCGCP
jgi:hypothetical protein